MQLFSQPLPSLCQVGLSFLGGVAIAVLLIPVNRWLAKKIGKLTEDMMAHKDSRVKVRGAAAAAGTPSLLPLLFDNHIHLLLCLGRAQLEPCLLMVCV